MSVCTGELKALYNNTCPSNLGREGREYSQCSFVEAKVSTVSVSLDLQVIPKYPC